MTQLPLRDMTTEQKLQAMEEIWRDLCRTSEDFVTPPWHADVLHAREARAREGKARFVDWEEAKRSLLNDDQK